MNKKREKGIYLVTYDVAEVPGFWSGEYWELPGIGERLSDAELKNIRETRYVMVEAKAFVSRLFPDVVDIITPELFKTLINKVYVHPALKAGGVFIPPTLADLAEDIPLPADRAGGLAKLADFMRDINRIGGKRNISPELLPPSDKK